MRNVEFKAELRDAPLARTIARRLGARPLGVLEQVDTYYRVPTGKLKRRETKGEPVEYIFYERREVAAPRLSTFTIYGQAEALERFGREPLPVWTVVRKRREFLMLDRVRIHLDAVETLGNFIEFEAMLITTGDEDGARRAIAELREAFAPAMGEPISRGYADLIAEEVTERGDREARA